MKREHSYTELRIRSVTKAEDRRRHRGHIIANEYRQTLDTLVSDFLKSFPKDAPASTYQHLYDTYDNRWREHCRHLKQRLPDVNVDPELFKKSVHMVGKHAMRTKRPLLWLWTYYLRPALPFVLLGAIIYTITDVVWPLFIK